MKRKCYNAYRNINEKGESDMSRPYVLPDPDDQSKNNPSTIANSDQVLGIYNKENPDDKMQKVTKKVQDWFCTTAKERGWDKAEFCGNQCILTNTRVQNT